MLSARSCTQGFISIISFNLQNDAGRWELTFSPSDRGSVQRSGTLSDRLVWFASLQSHTPCLQDVGPCSPASTRPSAPWHAVWILFTVARGEFYNQQPGRLAGRGWALFPVATSRWHHLPGDSRETCLPCSPSASGRSAPAGRASPARGRSPSSTSSTVRSGCSYGDPRVRSDGAQYLNYCNL